MLVIPCFKQVYNGLVTSLLVFWPFIRFIMALITSTSAFSHFWPFIQSIPTRKQGWSFQNSILIMLFLCLNLFSGRNHSFSDFIPPCCSDFISNYSACLSTMTIYSLHPQGLIISYPFFINSSFSSPSLPTLFFF